MTARAAMSLTVFVLIARTFATPTTLPSTADPLPSGLGVNIHFTQPGKGEMEQLAAAGFTFVRMDFSWERTEKKRGQYDWSKYDTLLKALEPHKIRAVFILDYTNALYDDNRSPDTDAGRAAFAKWAAAGVKHFAGRGVLWEMYNEPNIHPFWRPRPNTDDYIKLALATGKAIRATAPNETFIGPACSTMDFPFLESCFQAGLLEYFRAVSVHPYRPQPPETVAEDYRRLRVLIEKYKPKDASIPIYSGEWGYSSAWSGVGEDKQGELLPRQWLTNIANDVPLSIWYDWHDDGEDPREFEHHFGTVHHDYTPKPVYVAAKKLTDELRGFRFNKRLWVEKDDDYVLLFEKGDELKVAAWALGAPHAIDVAGLAINLRSDVQYFSTPRISAMGKLADWQRAPMDLLILAPRDVNGKHVTRGDENTVLDVSSDLSPAIKQRTTLAILNPLRLTVKPGRDEIIAEIANPSAEPLTGKIIFNQASRPISIENKRYATITLPPADHALVELRDERNELVLASPNLRFARVTMSPDNYIVRAEGDKNVISTQSLGSGGHPREMRVSYAFDAGWKYVCVHPKTPITIEGKPTSLCQWIHEDGSGNHLRMRFMDSTGQTFQVDGPRMMRTDRQFVSFDFESSKSTHWGGANDGVIHHPMKLETLLLIDSADRTKTAGFVTIEAPTLVYEEPTATSKPR